MSDMDKYWEHLMELAEADQLRCIRIVPRVPPSDLTPDFEEYLQEAHNDEFAGKFVFVLLAMVHFYPRCRVLVEADEDDFYERHPGLERNLDVHDFPQAKLESYIRATMRSREAGMFFHFTDLDILIRLQGGLDNDIYGVDPRFDALLERLVASRGLFLETYENIWNEAHFQADLATYATDSAQ